MPMTGQAAFRRRLQLAVDAIFDGNVSSAAAGLHVSQPTLHKILSGKTRESMPSTVAHFADRLGVSEDWLKGGYDSHIDDPIEFGGIPTDVTPLRLLAFYGPRYARDKIQWIESITAPKTEYGKKILEAYQAWRSRRTVEVGDLIRACGFGAVSARIAAGKAPRWAPEHLATLRAETHAELRTLDFVVSTLRRLGESPSAKAT